MASELPYEVVSLIASHVDQDSRLTCAIVCKQWTEPFLNAHWYYLTIYRRVADRICDSSNLENEYLSNAHRVYELAFIDQSLVDVEYRSKLLQIYSGIKRLKYFEPHRRHHVVEIIDWSSWTFLSHLEIHFQYPSYILLKDVFKNLSGLPCLLHLTLVHRYSPADFDIKNTVSWLDIESLHLNVPRLEGLNIDFTHIKIPNNDMNKIRYILPACTVTKAIFDNDTVDASWVFYFALKYPNLHHLEFKNNGTVYKSCEAYNEKYYEKDSRLLSTLHQFFPCLTNISLDPLNRNPWPFSIFYDTLRHFDVKVKRAKVRVIYCDQTWTRSLHSCIGFSSESLRILWADLGSYLYKSLITSLLPFYPCLVELHFTFSGSIEIDIILDKFPSLRWLDINLSLTHLSEQPNYAPHHLQRLELHHLHASKSIFKYVSSRCKQLLFMKLEHVGFKMSEVTKNREICIEMPYTQLETLIIWGVKTYHGFIKHYVIKQENNIDISQSNVSNQEQHTLSNWYHITKETDGVKSLAWELGKHEAEYAQKFYEDVTKFNDDNSQDMDHEYIVYHYTIKKDWKLHLNCGLLSLRFKSVKAYHLDKEVLTKYHCFFPLVYSPSFWESNGRSG
ncbi:hypothetical protein F4703DRAFT_1797975 [Phycomyces blakesleeanus]